MLTIEGIFDGQKVEALGDIPFTEKKRVLITFLDEMLFEPEKPSEVDPIAMLRGRAKGSHLTEKLLASRQEDRRREESKKNR
jgi:hypothetical protein